MKPILEHRKLMVQDEVSEVCRGQVRQGLGNSGGKFKYQCNGKLLEDFKLKCQGPNLHHKRAPRVAL